MVGRRNLKEIKEVILNLLADSREYSINHICKKINSNWMTVNEALDDLEKEGRVLKKKIGQITLFSIVDTDTYFKLPIEDKEKKLCWYIYSKIAQQWKKLKGEIPNPLIMQKIIADTANKFQLPIIKGWYLYGEMSPVIPLLETKIEEFPKKEYPKINKKELIDVLKKTTLKYAKCKSNSEIIQEHYKRAPEIYKLKLEISKILAFSKTQTNRLNKLLARFLLYAPIEENAREITKNIYDFVILTGKIIKINKFAEPQINLDIKITFEKLWELIASYTFFTQILESFKLKKLSDKEKQVKEYFLGIIDTKKSDFSLMFNSLREKYDSAITKKDIKVEDIKLKNKEIAFAFSNMD